MRTQSAGTLALLLFFSLPACGGDDGIPNNSSASRQANAANFQASVSPESNPQTAPSPEEIPVYTYEIVASYPHDPKAYTQGLVFRDGLFYESTGQYDQSTLRKVEFKKGKVKKKIDVPGQYFAEGVTIFNSKIYQLTWLQGKGFIYDLKDFKLEGEFTYEGEGWGLTNDGQLLILSDGTNRLRFIDPATFHVVKILSVTDGQQPVAGLNELEYIHGAIFANIWKKDKIARIDPLTGRVLAWIDLDGLRPPETMQNSENVLNGIAYDEANDRLYVTGKRWPQVFEIRLRRK